MRDPWPFQIIKAVYLAIWAVFLVLIGLGLAGRL